MLEVRDVWKSYLGIPAVRGVNLTAGPGQVIGLLGPNGSGKSTTVKMLVGLLDPVRGQIRWNGVSIHDQLLDYQARVGYVPEEPRLYAYLSAPEYLELVGGLRGIPRATLERRITRYLDLFNLSSDRYAPLSAFSKTLRWKWFPFLLALNVFAFQLSDVQLAAMASPRGVAWYVGVLGGLALAIHLRRSYENRHRTVTFDAEADETLERLNLSEALQ